MAEPPKATGSGLSHDQLAALPPFINDADLAKLREETDDEIPTDFDATAAKQRLEAAQSARATASASEIQKEGLQVNVPAIASLVANAAEDLPSPTKKYRLDEDGMAQVQRLHNDKIHPSPVDVAGNAGGDEDDTDVDAEDDDESEEDEDVEARAKNLVGDGWDGLPPAAKQDLREYFHRQNRMRGVLNVIHADDEAGSDPPFEPAAHQFDMIGSLSSKLELIVEVCKYLRPRDVVNLYSVSRDFHGTIDQYLMSTMRSLARTMAPGSSRIYPFEIYKGTSMLDPAGRADDPSVYHRRVLLPKGGVFACDQPQHVKMVFKGDTPMPMRSVPTLIWLQMVVIREKRVRDILAVLARAGHRCPPGTAEVLRKLWLVMDMATNAQRRHLMKNEHFFTDDELYMAQLFMMKLSLRMNDPIFGPGTIDLMLLLLGQRNGFTALWKFLRGKAYTNLRELVQLQVRYSLEPTEDQVITGLPVFGIPIEEVGSIHLEGWGSGNQHLMRIDELIIAEATNRQLDLEEQLDSMLFYGAVDVNTGKSLAPSVEELYMSDDELPEVLPDSELGIHGGGGNVPFRYRDWTPKAVRKARWEELTPEEKREIITEDKDELRKDQA